MKDFYEFDEDRYTRRSNAWRYIAIAIIAALVGALIMYYAMPVANGSEKIDKNNKQNIADSSKDNDDNTVYTKSDLFMKSDNPVVEIAEKVGPAVVGITNKSEVLVQDFFFNERVMEQEGYGSGIVISKDGYIVTNYHVVEGTKELFVILEGGKKIKAKLIGGDKKSDVAVVKIDEPNLTVANIGDSDKVKPGELAVAIGNPLGHELAGTITAGIVSAVNRNLNVNGRTLKLIQTDAAISPGNSGGALINSRGEVIGMNTVKIIDDGNSKAEGLGFAIPSNDFMAIAKELMEKGMIERPGLGVMIQEISKEQAKQLEYPVGVYVRAVASEGPAAKAGIRPGDVIVGIGDKDVKTIEDMTGEIKKHKVGDVVTIRIWRDGQEQNTLVTLEQLKD